MSVDWDEVDLPKHSMYIDETRVEFSWVANGKCLQLILDGRPRLFWKHGPDYGMDDVNDLVSRLEWLVA